MKKIIVRVMVVVPLIAMSSLAQEKASNRPLGVPDNYVVTPFGYFHPSCVRHVAEGEVVLADGRIQHADGSVDTIAPVCDYPHFSPTGAPPTWGNAASEIQGPVTNGWVENISATTTAAYG